MSGASSSGDGIESNAKKNPSPSSSPLRSSSSKSKRQKITSITSIISPVASISHDLLKELSNSLREARESIDQSPSAEFFIEEFSQILPWALEHLKNSLEENSFRPPAPHHHTRRSSTPVGGRQVSSRSSSLSSNSPSLPIPSVTIQLHAVWRHEIISNFLRPISSFLGLTNGTSTLPFDTQPSFSAFLKSNERTNLLKDLLDTLLLIIREDIEVNSADAMQIFIDINKALRSSVEEWVPSLLDYIIGLFNNFGFVIEERFNSFYDVPSMNDLIMIPSYKSFKLLHDAPVMIVLLFQLHRRFIAEYIPQFAPLVVKALLQKIPLSSSVKVSPEKELFSELIGAQVKILSFLAYIARGFSASTSLRSDKDSIPLIVIDLLDCCPIECASARKELLVAVRHILSTELRSAFLPHLSKLMEEALLLGKGPTAAAVFRPAAFSMLADLIHHIRMDLSPQMISAVISKYSQVLMDPTLPLAVQTMSIKLLLNLIDSIVSDRFPLLEKRNLLILIFSAILSKFRWMNTTVHAILAEGSCAIASLNCIWDPFLCDPLNSRPLSTDLVGGHSNSSFQSSSNIHKDPIKELRFQLKTLINGAKNIILALRTVPLSPTTSNSNSAVMGTNAPVQLRSPVVSGASTSNSLSPSLSINSAGFTSSEGGDLLVSLFKHGIGCFDILLIGNQTSNSTQTNSTPSITADEKELLDQFGFVFSLLEVNLFQDIISSSISTIIESGKDNIALLTIPQYFLSNVNTSKIFATILIKNLMKHFNNITTNSDEHISVILRLFKLLFLAVSVYPEENEAVLQPHLAEIVLGCFRARTSSVLLPPTHGCPPVNYLILLRSLFRSIGGGRFDALYKEILPLLPIVLEELACLANEPEMKELYVELTLTTPVRLSNLLPYLSYLMKPVVLALMGKENPDLVNQGLRTFELCLDNLTPDFLEPILAPVFPDLLRSLTEMLKPFPANQSHARIAVRLLGKLGGKNRRFVNPTHSDKIESGVKASLSLKIELYISNGEIKELNLSLDTFINSALRNLSSDDPQILKDSFSLLEKCVYRFLEIGGIYVDDDANVTIKRNVFKEERSSASLVSGSSITNPSITTDPHFSEIDNTSISTIISSIWKLHSNLLNKESDLKESIYRYLCKFYRIISKISISSKNILDFHSLFMIIIDGIGENDFDDEDNIISLSEDILHIINDEYTIAFPDKEIRFENELFLIITDLTISNCFKKIPENGDQQNIKRRVESCKVLVSLCEPSLYNQSIKFRWFYEIRFIRAILYVMKGLPSPFIHSTSGIDYKMNNKLTITTNPSSHTLSTLLLRLLTLCNDPSILSSSDIEDQARKGSLDQIMLALVTELSSPNCHVRSCVQEAFSLISKLQKCTINELLEPLRHRINGPIFSKPLRALPLHVQLGYIDAISYCLNLPSGKPLLELNDELMRLINEVIAVIESGLVIVSSGCNPLLASDDTPAPPPTSSSSSSSSNNSSSSNGASGSSNQIQLQQQQLLLGIMPNILSLRINCIEMLSGALALQDFQKGEPKIQSLRNQIVSLLFKTLYTRPPQLVERARAALEKVMNAPQQHKLPTELLQTGLRPVLQSLGDPRTLNLQAVEGLRRILQLFSHFFKAEIGKKLMDHLSWWSDHYTCPTLPSSSSSSSSNSILLDTKQIASPLDIKTITCIMELFCLLPSCGNMFMFDLIKVTIKLEKTLRFRSSSPFRAILLRFMSYYPDDVCNILLEKCLSCEEILLFLSNLFKIKDLGPERSILLKHLFMKCWGDIFDAFFEAQNQSVLITPEMRLSYLEISIILLKEGDKEDVYEKWTNIGKFMAMCWKRMQIAAGTAMAQSNTNSVDNSIAQSITDLTIEIINFTNLKRVNDIGIQIDALLCLCRTSSLPFLFEISSFPLEFRKWLIRNLEQEEDDDVCIERGSLIFVEWFSHTKENISDVKNLIRVCRLLILPSIAILKRKGILYQSFPSNLFNEITKFIFNGSLDSIDECLDLENIQIICSLFEDDENVPINNGNDLFKWLEKFTTSPDSTISSAALATFGKLSHLKASKKFDLCHPYSLCLRVLKSISSSVDVRPLVKQTLDYSLPSINEDDIISLFKTGLGCESLSKVEFSGPLLLTPIVSIWSQIISNPIPFTSEAKKQLIPYIVISIFRAAPSAFSSFEMRGEVIGISQTLLEWNSELDSPLFNELSQGTLISMLLNSLLKSICSLNDYSASPSSNTTLNSTLIDLLDVIRSITIILPQNETIKISLLDRLLNTFIPDSSSPDFYIIPANSSLMVLMGLKLLSISTLNSLTVEENYALIKKWSNVLIKCPSIFIDSSLLTPLLEVLSNVRGLLDEEEFEEAIFVSKSFDQNSIAFLIFFSNILSISDKSIGTFMNIFEIAVHKHISMDVEDEIYSNLSKAIYSSIISSKSHLVMDDNYWEILEELWKNSSSLPIIKEISLIIQESLLSLTIPLFKNITKILSLPNSVLSRISSLPLHSRKESREENDLLILYLDITFSIYENDHFQGEIRERLEGSFLRGLHSPSKKQRNLFISLIKDSTPDLYSRLKHIFETQKWGLVGSHYWLFPVTDLLFTIARAPCDTLDLCLSVSLSNKESCHDTFITFFPKIWALLSDRWREWISSRLVVLFATDSLLSQARMRPNVPLSIMAAISRSIPAPIGIPPFLLNWVMSTYGAWYDGLSLMEGCVEGGMDNYGMLNPSNIKSASLSTREEPWMELIAGLGRIYDDLGEGDMRSGVWRRGFLLPESNIALSYDQMDQFSLSQSLLENNMHRSRQGQLPWSEAEFGVWEERWLSSGKTLQQWDLLSDLSRADSNAEMGLECLWRLADWSAPETHAAAASLLKGCNEPNSRLKFFEAFLHLSHHGSLVINFSASGTSEQPNITKPIQNFNNSIEESLQLSLHEWQNLPHPSTTTKWSGFSLSPSHGRLLHSFQLMVEVQETIPLYSALGQPNIVTRTQFGSDLKGMLMAWRDRLPNPWDPIDWWSDLLAWRQHIFSTINAAYQPLFIEPPTSTSTSTSTSGLSNSNSTTPSFSSASGGSSGTSNVNNNNTTSSSSQQHPFAFRGYHEMAWLINRFAHISRKNKLNDVCLSFLNRIYTLPNIEIQDAFLKLREQAKCYMDIPTELPMALEVVNATNLNYFSGQQKGEFFALRAKIMSRLGMAEEANRIFAQAVQIDLNIGHGWAAWGRFNDERFGQGSAQDLSLAVNATNCYLQASTLFKAAKARRFLARILWILTFEDQKGTLGKSFEMYNQELPIWYWVSFIPQLLSSLGRREQKMARFILIKICRSYPQAIYLPLRSYNEECKIQIGTSNGSSSGNGSSISTPLSLSSSNSSSSNSNTAPTPIFKSPNELSDEIMSILKSGYPLLSLTMENCMEHIVHRMRSSIDEDFYRVLTSLIGEAYQHLMNRISGHTAGSSIIIQQSMSLMDASLKRVFSMICHSSSLGPIYKDLFEKDFISVMECDDDNNRFDNDGVNGVLMKLIEWRRKLEPILLSSPSFLVLDSLSRFLAEFEYHKYDELDIPGQYLLMRDGSNQDFIKIDRFDPIVAVVRRHGSSHRRLSMRGSDGISYKWAVQNPAGRQSRREERMVQLFRFLDLSLSKNIDCRRRNLFLSTPTLISISAHVRLLSDDSSLQSFEDVLEEDCHDSSNNFANNSEDIFLYFKDQIMKLLDSKEIDFEDTNAATNSAGSTSKNRMNLELLNLRTDLFTGIVGKVVKRDILKRWIQKRIPCSSDFWLYRQDFTRQLGMTIFQNYVFAIGHRFLHKMSFRSPANGSGRAEIVQSEMLPMVTASGQISLIEIVPFRFTPNLQHFVGQIGVEGPLLSSILSSSKCLGKGEGDLSDFLSLFVRDELLLWYLNYCSMQKQSSESSSTRPIVGEIVENPMEVLENSGIDSKAFYTRVQQNCELIMKRAQTLSCIREREQMQQFINVQQPNQSSSSEKNSSLMTTVPVGDIPIFQTVMDLISSATNPQKLAQMDGHWHPWF